MLRAIALQGVPSPAEEKACDTHTTICGIPIVTTNKANTVTIRLVSSAWRPMCCDEHLWGGADGAGRSICQMCGADSVVIWSGG